MPATHSIHVEAGDWKENVLSAGFERLLLSKLRTPASGVLLTLVGMAGLAQQPVQSVDPTPQNGDIYFLVNQLSGLQADLNAASTADGQAILQNPMNLVGLTQRWAFTRLPDGNWKIGNIANGLCMDTQQGSTPIATVQQPCASGQMSQEWAFGYTSNGYYTVTNASSGLLLDVSAGSTAAAAPLVQTPLASAPSQSQLWLFRPPFFRGIDNALLAKQEADRLANPTAFFNDAGQTQDSLLILKKHGFNMVRVRPAPTVVPGTTAPLYTTYTVGATNPAIPGTCSGNGCDAETDAADIAIAKRARQLGMSVELTVFFDGASSLAAPGGWAGYNATQVASAIYTYVKAQVEEYRAAGVMPDVVSIGNEVNTGFLGTGVAAGASGSPSGAYNSAAFTNFANYQKQGMQAVLDAASDTALGPAIPPPLRCIHTTPAWLIGSFFPEATQAGIPYEMVCQSYYPIFHGPLTSAQATSCKSTTSSETEQQNLADGAAAVGKPILMLEIGERYETGFNNNDCFYPVSRAGQRQFALDVESTVRALPGNVAAGMLWWDATGTNVPLPGGSYANYNASGNVSDLYYWDGFTLFDDADNGTYSDNFAAPTYNSVLPALSAVGGKLDATIPYKLVNAADSRLLEATATSGLDTALDTGGATTAQQWKISSNGDGYLQVTSLLGGGGAALVLDNGASSASGSAISLQPQSTSSLPQQEWDIVSAANGTFTLVNRQSSLVLAASATGTAATLVQQTPQSANVDWVTPASPAQQWQIVPVRLTASVTTGSSGSLLAFASTLPPRPAVGTSLGSVVVDIQNPAGTVDISSSAIVTLVLTGPAGYSQSFMQTASLGVATFSLSGTNLPAAGTYTLTATSTGVSSATASFQVTAAVLTITGVNVSRAYGLANPTLTYTVSGFVNGDSQAVLSGAPSLVTTAIASSPVGSYPIAVAAGTLAASNYTFTFANGTLTVTPASTSILWAPSVTHNYNGQALGAGVLDATTSIPGSIFYTASLSGAPPIPITATSGLSAGSYTLVATLVPADSLDYLGSSASSVFTVAPQSIFVADTGGGLSKFDDGGTAASTQSQPGGSSAVAIDSQGSIWSLTSTGVVRTDATGAAGPAIGAVGGLNTPAALAIDGLGQVWIANGNASITALSNSGAAITPASGYTDTSLNAPSGIAIDSSGNVWISNAGNNSVTEIIGAAAPTPPIANAVANSSPGVRP